MAMDDVILFTGRELNFEVPKMTELNSAEQRLRDKITKQEDLQTKYQDEIRKNLAIDTSALVSDFSRTQQYEAVKAFQDKWTKIAKERGNKLTSDDLMEMEKDRFGIANLQNEWKSSQALWEHDKAMIQKSPGDFDRDKFTADTDAFLSTGQYKPNSLEFSGVNMDDFFAASRWKGSSYSTETRTGSSGGFDTFETRSGVATKDEAERYILQTILSDTTGRALKGVIKDFMSESPEKKAEVLKDFDTDNSGSISPSEMASANVKMSSRDILTNPILAYAKERYLASVMKEKVGSKDKRRPKPSTDPTAYETQSWKDPVTGVTHSKKVPATEAPSGDGNEGVGIKVVDGSYNLGRGGEPVVFDEPQSFAGVDNVVNVKAASFNPDSKKVKFAVTSKIGWRKKTDTTSTLELSVDDILKMPDNDVKKSVLSTVINTSKGDMTIGDFAKGVDPTAKPAEGTASKLSLIEWKKQNPGGTAVEYKAYLAQ
jgi:hypothetical protein